MECRGAEPLLHGVALTASGAAVTRMSASTIGNLLIDNILHVVLDLV
jgi:hypothetical protein